MKGFHPLETHTPELSSVLGMLEYEGVVCCRALSAGGVFDGGPEVVDTGCAAGFRVCQGHSGGAERDDLAQPPYFIHEELRLKRLSS